MLSVYSFKGNILRDEILTGQLCEYQAARVGGGSWAQQSITKGLRVRGGGAVAVPAPRRAVRAQQELVSGRVTAAHWRPSKDLGLSHDRRGVVMELVVKEPACRCRGHKRRRFDA